MTRFMRELSGELGDYWKKSAEKELASVQAELANGEITIDEHGIARNCAGRVLMADMLEKVALLTDKVNAEATSAAYAEEAHRDVQAYRARECAPSDEELAEMRAAFGPGTTVVNVFTGRVTHL